MTSPTRGSQRIVPLLLAAAMMLAGCASRPPADDPAALSAFQERNDPLEPLNRATHDFNMAFDRAFMKPVAQVYRAILPTPIRQMITNFLWNLQTPLILANDLLQGEIERGGVTLGRFAANTTFGVGGLFDPATEWGMERHTEDFGETLAVWGVGEGFYLVVPFLGPSNPRDFVGFVTEFFIDPVSNELHDQDLSYLSYTRTGLEIVDFRARNIGTLEDLERNSTDFYAAMRSAYRQNRKFRISNGETEPSKEEEDIFEEEPEEPK
ncbi:MAG: hypothetical protein DCC73_08345 [Proteobacteria bacterium]|nr:MAG: hypothetical protein DCC73_08345 [Pseudomonadota bacterium]